MSNWWLAASSWQCAHSRITSHAEFFCETSTHPGDSAPYSPDLVPCNFWLFPKLKSPLRGKRFQTVEVQENMMVIGRTVWVPKVPALRGTEASLSFVQCFLYLVSSSVNVSICHSLWLHNFWTDYVPLHVYTHIDIYIHIYVYTYTHAYTYMYTHI